MKENRKIVITVLTLILLGGLIVYPFLPILNISVKLLSHRVHIKNNLANAEQLDTLLMEESQFNSLADKNEISVNGYKYDVQKVIKLPNKTLQVIAFKDNLETHMLSEIVKLFSNDHKGNIKIKLWTSPDWNIQNIELIKSNITYYFQQKFIYKNVVGLELNLIFPQPPSSILLALNS